MVLQDLHTWDMHLLYLSTLNLYLELGRPQRNTKDRTLEGSTSIGWLHMNNGAVTVEIRHHSHPLHASYLLHLKGTRHFHLAHNKWPMTNKYIARTMCWGLLHHSITIFCISPSIGVLTVMHPQNRCWSPWDISTSGFTLQWPKKRWMCH